MPPVSTLTRRSALATTTTALLVRPGLAQAQAQTTLTVMQPEAPRSMDPGDHTATQTATVLDPMFEGLLGWDQALGVVPALATDWHSAGNGKVWTFTLRHDVRFHDGTPLDAAAVAASFARFLDAKRGLAAAGRIKAVLDGVRAVNDDTVEFTLRAPYAGFLALLTTGTAKIVSPKADAAGNLGRAPVGTGPFRFVEWNTSSHVLMARNAEYWGEKPTLDAIRFTWSAEPSVLAMAVQANEADVVSPLPPVFAKPVSANPTLALIDSPGDAVYWVALNTKLKPLDDVRVRQALCCATDREAMVASLLRGYATAANSPLPPRNPDYDASLHPYGYDPDKARQLLREAGLPNGFSLAVAVQDGDAAIAEALQGMWSKAGVQLEIRKLEGGVWTRVSFADPAAKQADKLGATIASWSSGGAIADLQLRPLYHSASAAPAGANLGFFSDPKLDALIDGGAATLDPAEGKRIYGEAQRLINDEAPHVLLYYRRDLVATTAKVSHVWLQPGGVVTVRQAAKAV